MLQKLILFFFISLLSLNSFAQDIGRFSELDNKIIARDMDVMSFMLKLGEEVERKQGMPMTDKAWADDLADASIELMKRAYADGPQERALIEKFKDVFNWQMLWEKTKSFSTQVKSFARLKGLGAAFILVVSTPSDLYFPVIATAMGAPHLIPIFPLIPDTPMLLFAEGAIRNYQSTKRIKEAIGGSQAYKDFLNSRKELLKEMHVKASDYIHPLSKVDNGLEAIVISKSSVMKKIMGTLGFKQEGVTLASVKKFIKDRGLMEDREIKSILTQLDLPDEVKAGQLVYHLRYQRGGEFTDEVVEQFSDSFRTFKISPAHGALWDTYQDLIQAKNIQQIADALETASTHVSPKQLAQLWKEKLIPEWSKNLEGVSIFEFRRLVKGFDSVYGSMIAPNAPEQLDDVTKKQLFAYLQRVNPKKELCNDALRVM
jgi:hypothetical protein